MGNYITKLFNRLFGRENKPERVECTHDFVTKLVYYDVIRTRYVNMSNVVVINVESECTRCSKAVNKEISTFSFPRNDLGSEGRLREFVRDLRDIGYKSKEEAISKRFGVKEDE